MQGINFAVEHMLKQVSMYTPEDTIINGLCENIAFSFQLTNPDQNEAVMKYIRSAFDPKNAITTLM